MSKIPSFITDNEELRRFTEIIRGLLQTLDRDNYRGLVLSGTTAATADTAKKFVHNTDRVPKLIWPIEGDVYIPKGGLGPKDIDVRSRLTDHEFTLFIAF